MRSTPKCLVVAVALAALTTGGTAPLLAQSVYSPDVNTADRHFAVPVRWGHLHNYIPDDNPRGQKSVYSPVDH
jgi:hypothetical protein